MHYSLGRARLVSKFLPVSISPPLGRSLSSLRSVYPSSSISPSTWQLPSSRAPSSLSDSRNDLKFNYSSGRW